MGITEIDKTYTLYDNIVTVAMKWMAYNSDRKGNIAFYGCNQINERFLGLLSIACLWARTYEKTVYISCSFWQYIYLKYIKKLSVLKRANPQNAVFPIDMEEFIQELAAYFDVPDYILGDIYNEYYNRSRRNG